MTRCGSSHAEGTAPQYFQEWPCRLMQSLPSEARYFNVGSCGFKVSLFTRLIPADVWRKPTLIYEQRGSPLTDRLQQSTNTICNVTIRVLVAGSKESLIGLGLVLVPCLSRFLLRFWFIREFGNVQKGSLTVRVLLLCAYSRTWKEHNPIRNTFDPFAVFH